MAGSRTYRTKAIVLDKTKLKETDLILTLLAESGRQVRAVAKGARKPGSRLAARCDLCCEVDLLLAHGRSLDVVSQAELVAAPLGASADFELLAAASAVAEVARHCSFHCSFEDAEDPFVFAITRAALETLSGMKTILRDCDLEAQKSAFCENDPSRLRSRDIDCSARQDMLVAAYVFKVLSHTGYRPDYSGCVACGDEDVSRFSAIAGGLLCDSCASTVAGAVRVDPGAVEWLRSLMALRFPDLAAAPIDAARATQLLSLAHMWAATHLDCRLRSLEFLLGL